MAGTLTAEGLDELRDLPQVSAREQVRTGDTVCGRFGLGTTPPPRTRRVAAGRPTR